MKVDHIRLSSKIHEINSERGNHVYFGPTDFTLKTKSLYTHQNKKLLEILFTIQPAFLVIPCSKLEHVHWNTWKILTRKAVSFDLRILKWPDRVWERPAGKIHCILLNFLKLTLNKLLNFLKLTLNKREVSFWQECTQGVCAVLFFQRDGCERNYILGVFRDVASIVWLNLLMLWVISFLWAKQQRLIISKPAQNRCTVSTYITFLCKK